MGISWEDFDRWYKERNMEKLFLGLKDQNMLIRMETAKILGEIGDEKAVDPLIDALKDKAEDVIYAARKSLDTIGGTKAIKYLAEHLIKALNDKKWGERVAAVSCLGEIDTSKYNIQKENILNALINVLSDKVEYVQILAAEALGDIGDEKAVEPLRKMLGSKARDVYKAAKISLEQIGTPKAAEAIQKGFEDKRTPYQIVKDIVLDIFEDFYPPEDEEKISLNINPNDFDVDPCPFFEELENVFCLNNHAFVDISVYTLKKIIKKITDEWDGKTLNW